MKRRQFIRNATAWAFTGLIFVPRLRGQSPGIPGSSTAFLKPRAASAAGFSIVAHTAKGSTNALSVTSDAIDTTGATALYVAVAWYSAGSTVLTDLKGNTWVASSNYGGGGNANTKIYHCISSPTVGTGHTFTFTAAYAAIAVIAVSGSTVTADGESGANANGTSLQPGSITPTGNGAFLVSPIGFNPDATMSINSSFTISDAIVFDSGVGHVGIAFAYYTQPTAAAINPTWSWTGTVDAAAAMRAYKP